MQNSSKSSTFACLMCGNKFTQKKNLYAHMRKYHHTEPLKSKSNSFNCNLCNKKFCRQFTLRRHIKQTHNEHNYSLTISAKKSRIICPHDTCSEDLKSYISLRQHLLEQHNIDIECEDLIFNSTEDFDKWKCQMEEDTLSSYIQNTAMRSLKDGENRVFLDCHRSYQYKSKGKNIRTVKFLGSNKIGKACPSRLEVIFNQSNKKTKVSVKYWKTHCGHTKQIERISLDQAVRSKIAGQLKKGISFDEILDNIRGSEFNNTSERALLLTRKDLYNIVRDFNIDYVSKNDKICVEILYYTEQNDDSCDSE